VKVKGCELGGALKRLGGDEELFEELVTYFIEDAPGLLKAVRLGLAAGSGPMVHRAAHSLRGLAANFDAEQVMRLAGSIEQMASQGDLLQVVAPLASLDSEVQSLRDSLQEYLVHSASHRLGITPCRPPLAGLATPPPQ